MQIITSDYKETQLTKNRAERMMSLFFITALIAGSCLTAFSARQPALAKKPALEYSVPDLLDFQFFSAKQAWMLKSNTLYLTIDGGGSWTQISPDASYDAILSVSFIADGHGWVVAATDTAGTPGYLLFRTSDLGRNWQTLPLNLFEAGDPELYPSAIYMDWVDEKTGWLVIKIGTSSNSSIGTLFRSLDGGTTWNRLSIPLGEPVKFISSQIGWVAGGAGGDQLYRTTNGGSSWSSQKITPPSGSLIFHQNPVFMNQSSGILPVIVQTKTYSRVDFFITNNAGGNWTYNGNIIFDSHSTGGIPSVKILGTDRYEVISPDGSRIYLSESGRIQEIKSNNTFTSLHGKFWGSQIGLGEGILKTCAIDDESITIGIKTGFTCTVDKLVYYTLNGGMDWIPISLPVMRLLASSSTIADDNTINFSSSESLAATVSLTASTHVFNGQGFDSCNPPSLAQMQDWWDHSPYEVWNIYMGGSNMGCKATNIPTITQPYITALAQQGWKFIPLWVGRQAPCSTGNFYKISYDPATAYDQGATEANAAADRAANLGMDRTIVYFDLEAYDTGNAECRAATKSFIAGWTSGLHTRGFQAGVYGAACASGLPDFNTIPDKPDALWIAHWIYSTYNPNASVYGTACYPDNLYNNHQRIRQYSGDHNETWGNTTWEIDCDVFDGIVAVPGGVNTSLPGIPILMGPGNSSFLNEGESATLVWSATGAEYFGQLIGGPTGSESFGWLPLNTFSPGLQNPGYTYAWYVKARNSAGEGPYSATWSYSIRPAAPTNLIAETSSTQIDLAWMDNSQYEDGFRIYRNGTLIATIESGSIYYQDAGLAEGSNYSYQVRAFRGAYESLPSNTASSSIPLNCYSLTRSISPAGYGSISVSPPPNCNNGSQYSKGSVVNISATPITSTVFFSWSGAASGNTNPIVIQLTENKTITANFALKTHNFDLTIIGTGSGKVTSNPAGISCPAECTNTYSHGTILTLNATAEAGSYFTGWSGACVGTGNCWVNMISAQRVTANFIPCYQVSAVIDPSNGGSVRLSPAPNCGPLYRPGTLVTLTATPNSAFVFSSWQGDLTGGNTWGSLLVNSNKNIIARFLPCYPLVTSIFPPSSGAISVQPGANCGQGLYKKGTPLTIYATPFPGAVFTGWNGNLNGTANPAPFVIDAAANITATFAAIPSIPIQIIPAHYTLVTGAATIFDWTDSSPGLHHYEIQIARDINFSDLVVSQASLVASSYTQSSLPANSVLYWRIRSVNSLGLSFGWSAVRAIRTPPPAPLLLMPINGSITGTLRPSFSWQVVPGALNYAIQISRDNAFTLLVHSISLQGVTSYAPNVDLPRNATMYWRLQARTESGYSSWSEIRSFTTSNPAPSPVLLLPVENALITEANVLFDWSDITIPVGSSFQKYELHYGTNASFTLPKVVEITGAVSNSQYQASDMQPNTTWYWRVRAVSNSGEVGAWSATRSFRTAINPPMLLSPEDGAQEINLHPVFEWEDVPGSTGYTLQVSLSESFAIPILSVNLSGSTNSQHTPTTNFPADALLYWRVQTNGFNGPSAFSSPAWSFRIANSSFEPALISPEVNALLSDLTPTFIWSKPTIPSGMSFDHYQLQVATDINFQLITCDVNIVDYNSATYTMDSNLSLNSTYYWRVRAWNSQGSSSSWSSTYYFRTSLTGPVLLSPTNGAIVPLYRPLLDWADIPGANSYTIQVATDVKFSSTWLYATTVSSNYTSPINLPLHIPLFWRVRANIPGSTSAWTTPEWSFTLAP